MSHAITDPPPPITAIEIILAISCVIPNSLVTRAGVIDYGFYTVIWDRLFGTLCPNYTGEFQAAAGE